MNIGWPLRITGAVALLVGGLVHLQLYFDGYRSIDKIGPSFLLNAIASALTAAILVARKDWFVKLAGLGVALGTIVAFIASRQGDGLFDFREQGLNPSPQAIIALIMEITAVVALATTFLPAVTDDSPQGSTAVAALSAAMSAVVVIGLGAYWARHDDSVTAGPPDGVQIAEFAFRPADLTVSRGTTVTWRNDDAVSHSVVATDLTFHSDNIKRGLTFEYTFDTAGRFSYVCGIHPQMSGIITVTD